MFDLDMVSICLRDRDLSSPQKLKTREQRHWTLSRTCHCGGGAFASRLAASQPASRQIKTKQVDRRTTVFFSGDRMNRDLRTALALALFACASVILSVPTSAQSVYGSIFGTVTD